MKKALLSTFEGSQAMDFASAHPRSNTIVQESHPQTGIDLTYISQSGDTSAPPAYAATGGDRYVGLDQFGRVDDQFYVNPSTVTSPTDRFQYSYDLDGNVLYKDVTEMGGTAATYSQLYHASAGLDSAAYDNLNRLTSFSQGTLSNTNAGNGSVLDTVASPTLTEGFTLDSVGNWDTFSNSGTGGETRTFNAQNEITNNSGSTTPTYDYDGNMTKNDGGATLVYNAWNQLVSYNGSVAKYQYLPGGQRASATTCSTGNTQFSYFSTDWQDLEDDLPPVGSGSVQATTYVWGLENVNELVERDSSGGTRLYAQHDANMDVTALLNTGGTVVERFSYDPYGVATVLNASWAATSDAYNWTYRWQGGLYDLTTGLYSFQRRDYSPTLGTWLENDPAGYIDGPNTYQAMLGAPIEKTDPYGLQAAPGGTGAAANSGGAQPDGSPQPGSGGAPAGQTGALAVSGVTLTDESPLDPGKVQQIFQDLGNDNFHVRDSASRALSQLLADHPSVEEAIWQYLDDPQQPEVASRLESAINHLPIANIQPDYENPNQIQVTLRPIDGGSSYKIDLSADGVGASLPKENELDPGTSEVLPPGDSGMQTITIVPGNTGTGTVHVTVTVQPAGGLDLGPGGSGSAQ